MFIVRKKTFKIRARAEGPARSGHNQYADVSSFSAFESVAFKLSRISMFMAFRPGVD
jgi:hypothetical protein